MKARPAILLKQPMTNWKIPFAIAGFSITPLMGMAYYHGSAALRGDARKQFSEGERRDAVLAQITKVYVANGRAVTASMRDRQELAPVVFLNDTLRRQGAAWRVNHTNGMTSETLNIS